MSQKKSKFYKDILKNTQLGKMSTSKRLFYDRYEIMNLLGSGGFGVTFLAKNIGLPGHPLCVIKQLCPQMNYSRNLTIAVKRFEREAKTLAQLGNHSQIPMLLDYFEIKGEFYLVQEYINGSTLSQEIKSTGVKSECEVKQFLWEILPVLQHVHNNRVIHRDIKPHNLLRCEDGRLVLIDFGAVKEELLQVNNSCAKRLEQTNFVGTLGFSPPEQLSLRPVYASDIYALGVTCLYLLTGKSPLEFKYDSGTGELCWEDHVHVSYHFSQVLNK